jgi:hypothetical protein
MRIFIDCEYNGFMGELISMALVADSGEEFYEVLRCAEPCEWVANNVIPILHKQPINALEFECVLQNFLMRFDHIHVIADWPDDIKHFCDALVTGPGRRLNTPPLTMEIIQIDAESELPHNALHDARGIREALTP